MLAQRLRRWPNIIPTLGQCLVFAGNVVKLYSKPSKLKSVVFQCSFIKAALVHCSKTYLMWIFCIMHIAVYATMIITVNTIATNFTKATTTNPVLAGLHTNSYLIAWSFHSLQLCHTIGH